MGQKSLKESVQESNVFFNLQLLATQIVEGAITGIHKSPFHGFSSEFAEHKIYNQGESTRHIDWKLFAKTDKLYTKRYEDETNLRCHFILDNSASMHYPEVKNFSITQLNKIGFSVLGTAVIIELLKKQRDTAGLSIYGDAYDFYAGEKGSERHYKLLLNALDEALKKQPEAADTNTVKYLHEIAEKLHRRSLVVFFTDMFQYHTNQDELFDALRHLKYNKHEVLLFHVLDHKTEVDFDFGPSPKRFIDVEIGEQVDLYAENVKDVYRKKVLDYMNAIKWECGKYKIKYVPVDIGEPFEKIMNTYLVERQKFV